VTVREPRWTDDDRGWALALLAEEAGMCPGGCGQPAEVSHDPKTARTWQVHTATCQACLVRDAQMESDAKESAGRGKLYGVRRNRRG